MDCHSKGVLGETLPRQEELQAGEPVHSVQAGLNSHQLPVSHLLGPGKGGWAEGRWGNSHQEG